MKIKIDKLFKSYGEKRVLENFSAEFPFNKMSSIMAPSGWGKTTLFRIMLGLEEADSGKIYGIDGKKIVSIFQEDRLCENLSAIVNLSITTNRPREEIISSLKHIGLDGSIDCPVSTLSGGMKRRVAILRAILSNADIVLMDEPFKGLDDNTRQLAISLTKKYTANKTVIIVTHLEEDITDLGCENNLIMQTI